MNLPNKHEQTFYDFLIQTKELYNIYMTQGKKYKDAFRLFEVNSQFLEFATQILKEVYSNSIDYYYLASLADHLISCKKQFSKHEQSHSLKKDDELSFMSEFCFPFQSVDNLLSR